MQAKIKNLLAVLSLLFLFQEAVIAAPNGDIYSATGNELVDSYTNVPVIFDSNSQIPNTIFDLTRISERFQSFAGIAGGPSVVDAGGATSNLLPWSKNGNVIEFKINSTDGFFLSATVNANMSLKMSDVDLNLSGNVKPTGVYVDFNSGTQDLVYELVSELYGRPLAVGQHPLDAGKKVLYITAEGAELESYNFAKIEAGKLTVFFDSFSQFENRTAREMMQGLGLSYDVNAAPYVNEFTIGVLLTQEPLAGDFNGDGVVDGSDFLAWQRGYGTQTGATPANGDADADGDVDAGDLGVWKDSFGDGANGTANLEPLIAPSSEEDLIAEGGGGNSDWIGEEHPELQFLAPADNKGNKKKPAKKKGNKKGNSKGKKKNPKPKTKKFLL